MMGEAFSYLHHFHSFCASPTYTPALYQAPQTSLSSPRSVPQPPPTRNSQITQPDRHTTAVSRASQDTRRLFTRSSTAMTRPRRSRARAEQQSLSHSGSPAARASPQQIRTRSRTARSSRHVVRRVAQVRETAEAVDANGEEQHAERRRQAAQRHGCGRHGGGHAAVEADLFCAARTLQLNLGVVELHQNGTFANPGPSNIILEYTRTRSQSHLGQQGHAL